jgi:L-lactate utilization protein LutC
VTGSGLARDWLQHRAGWSRPSQELVRAAEEVFTSRGWQVHRAADAGEARAHLDGLVAAGMSVIVHESRAWESLHLAVVLRARGVRVERFGPSGAEGDRASLTGADVGVTGATALVAETGTMLLAADDAYGQLVSNLPYTHVVVAPTFKIVPSLDDGLWLARRYAERVLGHAVPRYLGAISGPSRTGDIEFTIVQGMHGPGRVYLVLLDVEPGREMLGDLPADLLCP